MCDLVGNPEDRFSHNEAHMLVANFGYGDVPAEEEIRCAFDDN